MINAPILQIFWSYRFLFLVVMSLTFVAFAAVIFALPTRATVRSSIEIGSAFVGDKQEAFEPPDEVARRIPIVYGPAALLAMANKGVPASILAQLQTPRVESIGRSVVIVSTIDPNLEKEATEFQETTADYVIKELAPHAQALRESIAIRIALATQASDNLEQQIKDDVNEIERIAALSDDLRGQLETQRATLAALYQRTGTTLQPGESAMLEAQIRELREQLSGQTNLIGNLTFERSNIIHDLATARRRREAVDKALANAQFEKDSFNETHISLRSAVMPAATTLATRRLSLLSVAFAISLLVGFGAIVLVHNKGTARI